MSKFFAAAIAALCAGCAVGPNFEPPHPEMPATWRGKEKATSGDAVPAELATWWTAFNDPKLSDLIGRALAANLDLRVAEAQLRQSRAARGVVTGGLLPSLSTSAEYQRVQAGSHGADAFRTGLDALWELDVFGGTRRGIEAANANIIAARAGLSDVQVSLAAEVALNYVELRGAQQRIAIAQKNIDGQRHEADITRERFHAGFVSELDVANADALVATTQAQLPTFRTQVNQAIFAISVLLGRPPADLLDELTPEQALPATPPAIPAGLPSDLLRRRPDIRQAEAQLHAATAQIGVATADLFPKFSLTGNLGWQSSELQNLFSTSHFTAGIGPSINWNIFKGGSIKANIEVQKAVRDQSYAIYQKTVLTALQDVENALVAFEREQERQVALAAADAANDKAVRLSRELYVQGQTDFLRVLDAERSLYGTQDALVQSNVLIVTNVIALYKALGGGWEESSPTGSIAAVGPAAQSNVRE